jgi:hypothetical protein
MAQCVVDEGGPLRSVAGHKFDDFHNSEPLNLANNGMRIFELLYWIGNAGAQSYFNDQPDGMDQKLPPNWTVPDFMHPKFNFTDINDIEAINRKIKFRFTHEYMVGLFGRSERFARNPFGIRFGLGFDFAPIAYALPRVMYVLRQALDENTILNEFDLISTVFNWMWHTIHAVPKTDGTIAEFFPTLSHLAPVEMVDKKDQETRTIPMICTICFSPATILGSTPPSLNLSVTIDWKQDQITEMFDPYRIENHDPQRSQINVDMIHWLESYVLNGMIKTEDWTVSNMGCDSQQSHMGSFFRTMRYHHLPALIPLQLNHINRNKTVNPDIRFLQSSFIDNSSKCIRLVDGSGRIGYYAVFSVLFVTGAVVLIRSDSHGKQYQIRIPEIKTEDAVSPWQPIRLDWASKTRLETAIGNDDDGVPLENCDWIILHRVNKQSPSVPVATSNTNPSINNNNNNNNNTNSANNSNNMNPL